MSTEEEGERYVLEERRHETVRREVRLPSTIDPDGISASLKQGVLTVTIPEAEETEGRTIEVP